MGQEGAPPTAPTAEEIQARLEEKRRATATGQTGSGTSKASSTSKPTKSTKAAGAATVDTRTEDRTCACGTAFEATVTSIGGKDLPSPSICDACYDARHQPVTVEEPDRKRSVVKRLDECGVNVRKHGTSTIGGWMATNTGPRKAVEEFVSETLDAGRFGAVQGLYLCGPTGTGKTHLAVGAMRAVLEKDSSRTVLFDRAARFITTVLDTYGTGKTGRILEERERADLWVLDDLGQEKATTNGLRMFTDLMSAREGWPTIVTSNYTPPQLIQRFGNSENWKPLASRLGSQNFRVLQLSGRDRRISA